jgi:hypothetical protein
VLLVFGAPCQHKTLAGQEHGRTIPLSEVRRASQQSDLITATEIVRVPFFTRRPVAFCD